jgi:hypothetical protein
MNCQSPARVCDHLVSGNIMEKVFPAAGWILSLAAPVCCVSLQAA